MAEPVRVVVTGGAGQIAYSLLPNICNGAMFGPDQPVILHLLDIPPAMTALGGVVMELEDLAFPLLAGTLATSDPNQAFKDVDFAIFLGAFPRKDGMERKDLMAKNVGIFKDQGMALSNNAKKTCKSVVIGNPANTNCAILSHYAPEIPKANFSALTRLDHNRAKGQVGLKCGVSTSAVKNTIIWGNHSSTQYPDVSSATVNGTPVMQALDPTYLKGEFITTVQKRGAAVIAARKLSSACSAAKAVVDHMHDWVLGTPPDEYVSMAVYSDGTLYGVPEGIFYSFPVKCQGGSYSIVPGLEVSDFSREKMDLTAKELTEELELAKSLLD